jgi:hypothetical protein
VGILREGTLTPQKKCRMKIIKTRLATFGPVYSVLNGTALPSWSRMGKFSTAFKVSIVGRSLFVLISPSNSRELPTGMLDSRLGVVSIDARAGEAFFIMALNAMDFDCVCPVVSASAAPVAARSLGEATAMTARLWI